jgi:hypothetical protein
MYSSTFLIDAFFGFTLRSSRRRRPEALAEDAREVDDEEEEGLNAEEYGAEEEPCPPLEWGAPWVEEEEEEEEEPEEADAEEEEEGIPEGEPSMSSSPSS